MVAILAFPIFAYNADSLLNSGKIHYGVAIQGKQVGGLTGKEARKELASIKKELERGPAKLQWDEQTWQLNPQKIGARINMKSAIAEAEKIGFSGSLGDRIRQRLGALTGKYDIDPKVAVNKEIIDNFINKISSEIDKQAINPTVLIRGRKAIPVQGQTGLLVSKNTVKKLVKEVILEPNKRIKNLPVMVIPTSIKYSDAEKAAKKANDMMSAPITMRYTESTWTFTPQEISEMIEIREAKKSGSPEISVVIGVEKAKAKLEKLTGGVTREPQDAKFSISGNKVIIIPSREGVGVNIDKAVEDMNKVAGKKQAYERDLLLTSHTTAPKMTTEKAQSMGIKEKITSYTTTYGALARARVSNIHLLTKSLDGMILAPGETFSFNKAMGPRTAGKGYKEAPVILNGKLVPGLGGGVCQVATTMFNSVFFAGLPVLERRNHSFYISKYPTGRDASVSYPYPDLKFKNDTGAHILIKGYLSSNSVTVSLYGTDPGRKVNYSTSGFSGITAFPIERVADPNLEQGVENIVDVGETGKQVTVYRTVSKNGKVLFKDTFTSKYKPKVQVVNYGTKLPAVAPTSSLQQTPL